MLPKVELIEPAEQVAAKEKFEMLEKVDVKVELERVEIFPKLPPKLPTVRVVAVRLPVIRPDPLTSRVYAGEVVLMPTSPALLITMKGVPMSELEYGELTFLKTKQPSLDLVTNVVAQLLGAWTPLPPLAFDD